MGGLINKIVVNRWKRYAVVLVILSALGPYIAMGARLEHFVIYPLFIGLVMALAFGLKLNKRAFILGLPLFSSALFMIGLDCLFFSGERQVSFAASVDNILQPALLVFIFACLLEKPSIESTLKLGATVLVWSAVCMALIALMGFFFDISGFIQPFVDGENEVEQSVWYAAENIGRYNGIFNQPLEAGNFYSTALIALIMLNRLFQYDGSKYLVALIFIVIGGTLSLSKNFVILGVFIGTLLYFNLSRRRWYIYLIALSFLGISLFFVVYFFMGDAYRDSFITLYQNDGLVSLITAGRFGDEVTEVQRLFALFFQDGFYRGFGLGSQATLDNGFLEYAYQGGVAAIFFYCLFYFIAMTYSVLNFNSGYSKVALALLSYGFLASIGGPVITANRSNIGYIFLLCGCVIATQGVTKSMQSKKINCSKNYSQ